MATRPLSGDGLPVTTPLSRRALFGSAGKMAAASALASAPAFAAAALSSHPDAAIIAGLHRWCALVRAYITSPGDGDDPEWEALVDAAHDQIAAVAEFPARTVDGLAIKAHMALCHEYGGGRGNELIPNLEHGIMADQSLPKSVGVDLLRLSPILAAAVSGAAQ